MKAEFKSQIGRRFLTLLIGIILSFPFVLQAQSIDSTIVARVMLVQKNGVRSGKPIAAISITLRNTSADDVYIPYIFSLNRSYPRGSRINTFRREKGIFIADSSYGSIENEKSTASGIVFSNPISGSRNDIVDTHLQVAINKEKEQKVILEQYEQLSPDVSAKMEKDIFKPLFLKAHEEYEIYLIKDCDQLVNIPNEYKVSFEFNYNVAKSVGYPEKILNYKKFLPTKINSNVLFIKVEK